MATIPGEQPVAGIRIGRRAIVLEHAAALRALLADRTDAHVSVDVEPDVLERAADAWGPPHPHLASRRSQPFVQRKAATQAAPPLAR